MRGRQLREFVQGGSTLKKSTSVLLNISTCTAMKTNLCPELIDTFTLRRIEVVCYDRNCQRIEPRCLDTTYSDSIDDRLCTALHHCKRGIQSIKGMEFVISIPMGRAGIVCSGQFCLQLRADARMCVQHEAIRLPREHCSLSSC